MKNFWMGFLRPLAWLGIRVAGVYYSQHKDDKKRVIGQAVNDILQNTTIGVEPEN